MNNFERIASTIRYLDSHHCDQPDLATLARQLNLSPFHFHRLFTEWAGVTPKDFLQCLTLGHTKSMLRQGASVLDSALEAGLSGPARLHDLCLSLEAASPGELKSGGAGWTLTAGFADSPFGTCVIGENPRGLCHLSFVESRDKSRATAVITEDWPGTRIRWNNAHASQLANSIFARPHASRSRPPLRAFVRGTAFQVRVWRSLLLIPPGRLVSYGALAAAIHQPLASRAVGSAVGANPIAYLIPCHRVIRETGVIGEYRWGTPRKKAMIAWENIPRAATPEARTALS